MSTTNWTDEDLMAYADDQLAGERRAQLAAALAGDAALRQRVEALSAQRRRVAAAFADVLDDPVPDRLSALLAAPAAAAAAPAVVMDLAAERERRAAARRPGLGWAQWGGMAASVALGVMLGLQMASRGGAGDALLGEADGQVVAGSRLAQALSTQAAGEPAGRVAVQLSFVSKDGRYCRTFSADRVAGLACRDASQWVVQTTVAAENKATSGMRQAGSELPRAVLDAVDERIEGPALNAEQERSARAQGWQR